MTLGQRCIGYTVDSRVCYQEVAPLSTIHKTPINPCLATSVISKNPEMISQVYLPSITEFLQIGSGPSN